MKIIIQKRGTGKSKELMKAALDTPQGAILAYDKRAIKVKATNYGFDDLPIYDYSDLEKDNVPLDSKLFVLNGERFLQYLVDRYYNMEVLGFTATIDNDDTKKSSRAN